MRSAIKIHSRLLTLLAFLISLATVAVSTAKAEIPLQSFSDQDSDIVLAALRDPAKANPRAIELIRSIHSTAVAYITKDDNVPVPSTPMRILDTPPYKHREAVKSEWKVLHQQLMLELQQPMAASNRTLFVKGFTVLMYGSLLEEGRFGVDFEVMSSRENLGGLFAKVYGVKIKE